MIRGRTALALALTVVFIGASALAGMAVGTRYEFNRLCCDMPRGRNVVLSIREALGLTQREFARKFEIALGTLRDWEQGARRPDSAAKAYLRVIQQDPDAVLKALDRSRPASPERVTLAG